MSKYKVCPACGTQNDPRNMECSSCSYDLMSTRIVDSGSVSEPKEAVKIEQDQEYKELVRICSCGTTNPSQLRKCKYCHEDISDIIPVPKAEENEIRYQLEQVGTNYIYPLPCSTIIIGRENCMKECLENKSYVSRTHAKITSKNGKLYIENLSNTNYTYVNNTRIANGCIEIKIGDEIGLGGISIEGKRQEQAAFFIVGKMG